MYPNEKSFAGRPMFATEVVDSSYGGVAAQCVTERPESELESAIAYLDSRANVLNDLIGDVERRLAPVLCQPEPVKDPGTNGHMGQTPLLKTLSEHGQRLDAIAQRIAHLNSRIVL